MQHEPFVERAEGTVWRDVILLALLGFVAIVVLLLPHIRPPGEAEDDPARRAGDLIVEIQWPPHLDADVDLWVQAPMGDVPVGYSNKGGLYFNLLRDDLGQRADTTDINYEVSYSRGLPMGEYVVNLHLYRNRARIYPVPVKVDVSRRGPPPNYRIAKLFSSSVELEYEGEEITVFRFRLDEHGGLVPGTVSNLYKPLRAWTRHPG